MSMDACVFIKAQQNLTHCTDHWMSRVEEKQWRDQWRERAIREVPEDDGSTNLGSERGSVLGRIILRQAAGFDGSWRDLELVDELLDGWMDLQVSDAMPVRAKSRLIHLDVGLFAKDPTEVAMDSDRNWKGIITAIAFIVVICGLIVIAAVIVTPGQFLTLSASNT